MSDTTKIPFSFCRIKRAAEFLGIYTEDLLSLAVYNKITLCIRLDGLNSSLSVYGIANELNNWYLSLNNIPSGFSKSISTHSSFIINNILKDGDNHLLSPPLFHQEKITIAGNGGNEVNVSTIQKGRAYGLWVPQTSVIREILSNGESAIFSEPLGVCRTNDSTPNIYAIPLPLTDENIPYSEEVHENYGGKYQYIEITENNLWITSEQVKELLTCNHDYSELPSRHQQEAPSNAESINEIKNINYMAEHHATNREKLFKSAIFLLSKYPNECRGKRKEVSPEKWRDCIIAHKDEIPPLAITNEDVILKHLRSAANGKV